MYPFPTDAHCHANFERFANMRECPRGARICIDACFESDWLALRKFSAFEVKKAYGIHPDLRASTDARPFDDRIAGNLLSELEQYLISADAVGETGLDANIVDSVPMEIQKKLFESQLRLADKFGLPVIIHCVGVWGDALDILKRWAHGEGAFEGEQNLRISGDKKFLIHAAKCSAETVSEFSKIGGYFSFGLRELESRKGIACAACVPQDRFMTESDAEFSSDKMFEVAKRLADIRSVDINTVFESAAENFNNFYSK